MNHLVKIISNDDGDKLSKEEQVWHVAIKSDALRTLCTGEAFGFGESSCEYEEKWVKRGGITCDACLQKVKFIKKIRL